MHFQLSSRLAEIQRLPLAHVLSDHSLSSPCSIVKGADPAKPLSPGSLANWLLIKFGMWEVTSGKG